MDNTETVVGVGIDLCQSDKVPDFDEKHPFFRLFSRSEIEYCLSKPKPKSCFAARFAAREALLKAFGGYQSWMSKVEVVIKGHNPFFSGSIPNGFRLALSIANEGSMSIAIVLLLKK